MDESNVLACGDVVVVVVVFASVDSPVVGKLEVGDSAAVPPPHPVVASKINEEQSRSRRSI